MGRVKDWLMGMEEEAHYKRKDEFIKKHGRNNRKIWDRINSSNPVNNFEYYETDEDQVSDQERTLNEKFRQTG